MDWLKSKVSQVVGKVTDLAAENIVANKVNEVKEILDKIATNDSLSEATKVRWIIRGGSLFCALVAMQPLPFADVLLLTPIQVAMIHYLAKSMNIPMSENGAKEIVVYIAGVMGFGLMAQHTILGLYKAGLPFLGGVTTVPLVFAATYGMGIAAQTVLQARQTDRAISDAEVKSIYRQATERASEEVKAASLSQFRAEWEQLKEVARQKDEHIAQQQYKIDTLSKELASAMQANRSLEVQLYDFNKQLGAKETQINSIARKMKEIECRSNSASDREHAELQRQYNMMKVDKERLEQAANSMKQKLEATERQYEIELEKWIRQAETSKTEIFRNEKIRDRFIQLLQEAQHEVLIVSPWINYHVIQQLKEPMSVVLRRGARINIIYGIEDHSNGNRKEDLSDSMAQKLKYEWFHEFVRQGTFDIRKGNTHEKVVCCDGKKCLLGSYNYLSFGGRYDAGTRAEAAVLISEVVTVQKYCNEFRNAYNAAATP